MIEHTAAGSGWKAQCEDCPHVVEPDYGARVFPHEEFEDTDAGRHAAERWAIAHRTANPGHSPTVTQFWRWTMTTVEHLDLRLLEALFGHPQAVEPGDDHDRAEGIC